MKHLFLLLLFVLASFFSPLRAQSGVSAVLEVVGGYAVDTMVMDFFNGSCVDVTNIQYMGTNTQSALFLAQASELGVNAGILFTTGNYIFAPGPNDNDSAGESADNTFQSDPLFTALAQGAIFDLSLLHMTLVPHTDTINFEYVFASEEYCEYVNSNFNDVFAFFIQGPGYPTPTNIALVPGSNTSVAINNVNHLLNSNYYRHNTPAAGSNCGITPASGALVNEIQYDGLTTVLNARANVVPDSAYQVWIGITDVGDGVFDSGIFLSIESLCGDSVITPVAGFNVAVNGTTVGFSDHTRYATNWHWDFGDGSTSNLRNPTHEYATLNQQYTVMMVASNYCCSDTVITTVGTSGVGQLADDAFRAYPSQVTDLLIVEPNQGNTGGDMFLYDVSGQTVLTRSVDQRTELHLRHLPRGVYVLEIRTADQRRWVKKIVRI